MSSISCIEPHNLVEDTNRQAVPIPVVFDNCIIKIWITEAEKKRESIK